MGPDEEYLSVSFWFDYGCFRGDDVLNVSDFVFGDVGLMLGELRRRLEFIRLMKGLGLRRIWSVLRFIMRLLGMRMRRICRVGEMGNSIFM